MKDTREHIMKIALGLFLRDSYKGVTMSRIVAATGMSKGAFYHYFKSKESLFEAILDTNYVQIVTVDYLKCSHDSLYRFSQDILSLVIEKASVVATMNTEILVDLNYIFLMIEGARHYPLFYQRLVAHQINEIRVWSEMVGIARANGEIQSSMSDEQIAKLFIAVTDGVGIRIILSKGTVNEMIDEIRLIWDGIYSQLKV